MNRRYCQVMGRLVSPVGVLRSAVLCAPMVLCGVTVAQDAGGTPPPPTATTPSKSGGDSTPPDAPRSLDDLLGVPEESGSAEDAARREQEQRLQRSLDEASIQDLVQRALDGMKTASQRLSDAKDPGLGTQRIQEEVLRTLDRLLEEAQKKQGKKSSSSSSQKRSSGDSKPQDPSEQNGQEQGGKPRSQAGSSQGDSSELSDGEKNQSRDDAVAATTELAETRIEWGQLPERVRELVLQGRRDRVSTIYERLTREYYRRLAEEASR